jgi:hypothetical protein
VLVLAPPRVDAPVVYLAVLSLDAVVLQVSSLSTAADVAHGVGLCNLLSAWKLVFRTRTQPFCSPSRPAPRRRGWLADTAGSRRWGAYGRVRCEPVPKARARIRPRHPGRGQEHAGNDDGELTHFLLEGVLAQVLGRLVPLDLAASWCVCAGERRRWRGQGQGQEGGDDTQTQGDVGRASDRWDYGKIEAEIDFSAVVEC